MHSRSIVLAAVLVTAPAACGNGEGSAPEDPTFENVLNTVLLQQCTFGSCHANPTVAARLDLTAEKACNALTNKPSCLFPDRMRIVPGSPDESYFFHKLTGEGLDVPPATNCGDTNFIMPWGASALPESSIELVRNWITEGAKCELDPDYMEPPDDKTPAVIAGISASRPVPVAGESFMITVALSKGAPAEGQLVELFSDSSSLSVPVSRVIPAGETKWEFEAYALRPTPRFTLRVKTGQSTKQFILRIGGLVIAEVLADPPSLDDDGRQWIKLHNRTGVQIDLSGFDLKAGASNYDLIKVSLSGILLPGQCALIGGPKPASPDAPPYWGTPVNFDPDLPHMSTGVTGVALFARTPMPLDGIEAPVDAMIVGSSNSSRLLGPDADIPSPHCLTPASGLSTVRTGAATCVAAIPKPANCP